jgi:MFS family permease
VFRNIYLCLVLELLWAIFFGVSIMVLFYQSKHLEETAVNTFQSTVAFTSIWLGVPSGFIADRISVKRIIVGGTAVLALHTLVFASGHAFWQFEALAPVGAIGWSLIGGTTKSLISTTVIAVISDDPVRGKRYFDLFALRSTQVRGAGQLIGAFGGGAMASLWGFDFPFYAQAAVYVVAIVVALCLWDPRRHAKVTPARHLPLAALWRAVKMMLWERRDIRSFLALAAVMYTAPLLCFWLFQPRLKDADVDVAWFSWFYAIKAIAALALPGFTHWLRRRGDIVAWAVLILTLSAGAALGGILPGVTGVVALVVGQALVNAFVEHLDSICLNKLLPVSSKTRTSEFSVCSAVGQLLFAATAPFVGMVTESFSVQTACLVVSVGCLTLGGGALYAFARTRSGG